MIRDRLCWRVAVMTVVIFCAVPAGGAIYYVDAVDGVDTATGTSPQLAWKSLDKVNATTFAPGDYLLLKAGTVHRGQLWPKGSGDSKQSIVLGMYGAGPLPRIISADDTAIVKLHNQEYWDITNLDVTGSAVNAIGVSISLENFGVGHGIHLNNLVIHDLKSDKPTMEGGSNGILVTVDAGTSMSRWDGVLIEQCHVSNTGNHGIRVTGAFPGRDKWNPHTNVRIRQNLVEKMVVNDIVVIMCEGAVIESNVTRFGGRTSNPSGAGIWPWSSDNTIIQFNEVYGRKGVMDACAFDSDFNTRGTVIQYNYSHDNEGGFVLVCNKGKAKVAGNVGNQNTIVRFNLSVNDGRNTDPAASYLNKRGELVSIAGPTVGLRIYNNTFYVSDKLQIPFEFRDWGGWPKKTTIENNIFYIAKGATLKVWAGKATETIWANNCLFGDVVEDVPTGQLRVDPLFVSPGLTGAGFAATEGFRLKSASPLVRAGRAIVEQGGRDFAGNRMERSTIPAIGAYQPSLQDNQ